MATDRRLVTLLVCAASMMTARFDPRVACAGRAHAGPLEIDEALAAAAPELDGERLALRLLAPPTGARATAHDLMTALARLHAEDEDVAAYAELAGLCGDPTVDATVAFLVDAPARHARLERRVAARLVAIWFTGPR